jgi:hypothetical protein
MSIILRTSKFAANTGLTAMSGFSFHVVINRIGNFAQGCYVNALILNATQTTCGGLYTSAVGRFL